MEGDKNKKVYILDENDESRREATKLLAQLGYHVDQISVENSLLESILDNLNDNNSMQQQEFECSGVSKRFETLTNREKQVVGYLSLGAGYSTNKSIAKKMDISHRTVEEYRASAMRKMQADSFRDLITMVIVCKLFKT